MPIVFIFFVSIDSLFNIREIHYAYALNKDFLWICFR
jgi:hypothetical protein